MRQCIEKQHQNGHFSEMCHPNDTRVCIEWAYRRNIPDKYTKWINRLNICCRMHSMSHVIFHVCRMSVYQIKNSGVAHFILRCWLSAFAVCSQFWCCFFLQFNRFSAYYFINIVAFHSNMTSCFGAKREILCRG